MDISTTKQLAYEMSGLQKCAASIAYLYEWIPTQEPKVQGLLSVTVSLLEKEYERLNAHYIAFAQQALLSRQLRTEQEEK